VPEHQQFSIPDDVPDLSGKVAVITGGSRGIGYGCTQTLLQKNIAKVFIVSDTQAGIDEALKSVRANVSHEAADKITWLQCDLADWVAVTKVASQITKQTDRVDILINDAARGIMTYQLTDYGVDRHMAINHVAHVILTSHLLPILKKTAEKGDKVRIVCLGSNAHQGTTSDTKYESLEELNRDLGPNGQYGRSKLAQMLYCKYLAKHLTSQYPNVLANSVHPGFVETKQSTEDILEPFPISGHIMSDVINPFKKDQFEGAVSAMFAATKTDRSGEYICPPAVPEKGSSQYQDKDEVLMNNLMKLTTQLVREKKPKESVEKGCPLTLA
jgi:NAD(P)-dependent dehydrogenase (short-subunit alcohol dehydrogenase family)